MDPRDSRLRPPTTEHSLARRHAGPGSWSRVIASLSRCYLVLRNISCVWYLSSDSRAAEVMWTRDLLLRPVGMMLTYVMYYLSLRKYKQYVNMVVVSILLATT